MADEVDEDGWTATERMIQARGAQDALARGLVAQVGNILDNLRAIELPLSEENDLIFRRVVMDLMDFLQGRLREGGC